MTLVGATVAALALAARSGSGPALAVSAGLLWGASDIAIKAASDHTDLGLGLLVHPLAFVILILSLVGLLVSARSLQLGPVVPVIALTSASANIITIASGPTVFGEPLPGGPARAAGPARRVRAGDHGGGDDAAAENSDRERAGEAPA